MEHGASEHGKEQSHTAMPVKIEVDKAAQSTAYRGVQTNANFTEEEPELAELVKSEPAFLVKEEVVEDGWQDIAEQQCVQGPSTSAIVGSTNVFDSVADPGNPPNIKEELGSIDIGPTGHMNTQGTNNQKDMSVVKQERTINHDKTDPILCGGVKAEIIEDEWRGTPTPQDSLMEQLHKECLETVCRVQLIRLDTFQCDVCDAVYIDAHKLFQHVQDLHGPQKCATADTDDHRSNKAAQSGQRPRSQLYTCDKCGKTYASKLLLLAHNRNLHSTKSHECTRCDKIFPSKAYLYQHTRYVHSEQQYECAVCNKICKSKGILHKHVYRNHRPRPAADTDTQRSNEAVQSGQRAQSQWYSCDKCAKTYTCKESLMYHYRNLHSTEAHKCTKCKKIFPSKKYLNRHTSYAHSEQQYECAVCKKIYRSKIALYAHDYQVHRPRPAESRLRHTCTNCGQNFSTKWNRQKHEKRGKCARPTAATRAQRPARADSSAMWSL